MSSSLANVQIQFAEAMRGFVSSAMSFADGRTQGKQKGHKLSLDVTVTIPDLAHFLASSDHIGSLAGHIDAPLLGGKCPIASGTFRLLADTSDRNRKAMHYHIYAHTPAGEPLTLVGHKEVQNDGGPDIWHDTTTLFVNVFRGHVELPEQTHAKLWLSGILGLGVLDFMKSLSSLRARTSDGRSSIRGLVKFGKFFAGRLWSVYRPSLPPAPSQISRRIPRFTTEGVKGAEVTMYPFSTQDGLGLYMTRFCRAESDDVVLLMHGLTTSSDMFIMPEHENFVQYLLDHGWTDVWSFDYRGSGRYSYNLERHHFNFDDVALFDHPAALAELRRHIGPNRRIHVVAHCVGALTFAMSLFGKASDGVHSAVLNSVSLTPRVPKWCKVKLAAGPFMSDLVGFQYYKPGALRERGLSLRKLMALAISMGHHECDSPECHMLSFMWGSGRPAMYLHENMAKETHDRLGDLFGSVDVHYYRHVRKMVRHGAAVKAEPGNLKYASLPDDYFEHAKEIKTPILFIQGQANRVFADSNIRCFERLETIVPGRHQLHVFPGYGHQDIFMGKNVAQEIFPRLLAFLNEQRSKNKA